MYGELIMDATNHKVTDKTDKVGRFLYYVVQSLRTDLFSINENICFFLGPFLQ